MSICLSVSFRNSSLLGFLHSIFTQSLLNLHAISQQSFSSLLAVFQQSFGSLSAVFQQFFSSRSKFLINEHVPGPYPLSTAIASLVYLSGRPWVESTGWQSWVLWTDFNCSLMLNRDTSLDIKWRRIIAQLVRDVRPGLAGLCLARCCPYKHSPPTSVTRRLSLVGAQRVLANGRGGSDGWW